MRKLISIQGDARKRHAYSIGPKFGPLLIPKKENSKVLKIKCWERS